MRRQLNRKRLEIAKGRIAKRDTIDAIGDETPSLAKQTRLQWRNTKFKVNFLGCVTLDKQSSDFPQCLTDAASSSPSCKNIFFDCRMINDTMIELLMVNLTFLH